jgi:hypothetical protein
MFHMYISDEGVAERTDETGVQGRKLRSVTFLCRFLCEYSFFSFFGMLVTYRAFTLHKIQLSAKPVQRYISQNFRALTAETAFTVFIWIFFLAALNAVNVSLPTAVSFFSGGHLGESYLQWT